MNSLKNNNHVPRILLIHPSIEGSLRFSNDAILDVTDYGNFVPLGLLYLSAVVKQQIPNAQISLLDCIAERLSQETIAKRIREFNPTVIGITSYTDLLVSVCSIAKIAKEINSDIHVCVGGVHVFYYPYNTIIQKHIDSIVLGEGEYVFPEIITHIQKGLPLETIEHVYTKLKLPEKSLRGDAHGAHQGYIENIDTIPFPDRSLIKNPDLYFNTVGLAKRNITVLTSRGCPFPCAFCDVPYKSYRIRSIDNIIAEIKDTLSLGTREYFFYDDLFNISERRVIEFSTALLDEHINISWSFRGRVDRITAELLRLAKKAGCFQIHLGVETGDVHGLHEIRKKITIEQIKKAFTLAHNAKIRTVADFMIGLPHERSFFDIRRNIEFLISLNPDFAQINLFTPLPYTAYFDQGVTKGFCSYDAWKAFTKDPSEGFTPSYWTEHMTKEELEQSNRWAMRRFYLRISYVFKRILGLRSLPELKRNLKGVLTLIRGIYV
jgi:radical SAM superfamily enzyme YgiQ (UPF0313 family)